MKSEERAYLVAKSLATLWIGRRVDLRRNQQAELNTRIVTDTWQIAYRENLKFQLISSILIRV